MAKKEASDLHLKPMRPPLLRIKGKLIPLNTEALQPKDLESMLLAILSPAQKTKLEQNQSVDLGYGLAGVARFRANIFVQRGSYAAVFRRIPFKIPEITELGLPDVLETFVHIPTGLVLITGPTGSGKSTTLASIIRSTIEKRADHIVTIEDPIEYLLSDGIAAVSQREVGTDTPSFKEALKNIVRQDPDVIMVGEMRDWETMQTAITSYPAYQLGCPVDRPDDRFVPSRAPAAGPFAARARAARDHLDETDRKVRRHGTDRRRRGHGQFSEDRQAHRPGRDQG